MADRTRSYNIYDRKKLPRNKYGLLEDGNYSSSSVFGSGGVSGGGIDSYKDIPVGDLMATLEDFIGATATEDGYHGMVPAPLAGMNQYFLQGSGNWIDIPAYRWFTEWPESAGLEKRGLSLNGDLNVTDTIYTKNLEVTGAAHFFELVIDKIKANGGQLIVSPSMFQVDYVGGSVEYSIFDADGPLYQLISSRADVYNILKANDVSTVRCRRLYQRNDDGEKSIENECQIGDMMRCKSFNIKAGHYRNVANTDYWSFVCNTGEETYTDEDGNTYSAFFIDLAYTLRKSDGHNYPLGTKLFLDARAPEYPDGFVEITDAIELKRTNQDVLDGTRDVENEFFENSEWTDIQEYVIKIRGLDDQMEDITGMYSTNKLYDNDLYISKAKTSLDTALYGEGDVDDDVNPTGRRQMSALDWSSMITTGLPADNVSSLDSGVEEYQNRYISDAALGVYEPASANLSVRKTIRGKITLSENTVLEKPFVVAEDVYEDGYVGDSEHLIYSQGETLDGGTTLDANVPLIDLDNADEYFNHDIDTGTTTEITGDKKDIIENFDPNTPSGNESNPDKQMDVDYNILTEWEFGYTGYYPAFRIKQGDSLVCLGHLYDSTRQNAIVLSSTNPIDPELLAPAMAQYSGIDRFGINISDYRITAIAANGNEFMGSFFINYNNTYVEVNDRIQMFINDVTTGLESCGIHLNGENSTITMVGSIDLRQHSQTSYDTLSLYDNLNVKRVEMLPFPIPKRSSSTSQIDTGKLSIPYANARTTVPKEYVDKHKYWNPLESVWYSQREYTLKNYTINYTVNVDLGELKMNWKLDLRELNLYLNLTSLFNGSITVNDFGIGEQEIVSLTYTLKRNGMNVNGYTNRDMTYAPPGGLNSGKINIYVNQVVDDFDVPFTGTYSLEIKLAFKVYSYYKSTNDYSNYYYVINSSFGGNILYDLTKIQQDIDDSAGYKMTIGTDGLVFQNNNSKYFYAGSDGIEMRWDVKEPSPSTVGSSASIRMDDDHGLSIRPAIYTTNSAATIPAKYSVVNCIANGSYTITLPSAEEYGSGRIITILGFGDALGGAKLTVKTASDSSYIQVYLLGTYFSATELTFCNSDKGPFMSVQLMAIGNNWYGISAM